MFDDIEATLKKILLSSKLRALQKHDPYDFVNIVLCGEERLYHHKEGDLQKWCVKPLETATTVVTKFIGSQTVLLW